MDAPPGHHSERTASEPADVARLHAEAGWLRTAAGAGVATVLDVRTTDEGTVLVTACPPGVPLGAASLRLDRWRSVATSCADTLARLHACGMALGGVDPQRIVVPPLGPPTLSSLAGARPRALGDPRADVAALATALLEALDRADGNDPGRRRVLTRARAAPPDAAVLARRLRRGRAAPSRRAGVGAGGVVAVVIAAAVTTLPRGPTAAPAPGTVPVEHPAPAATRRSAIGAAGTTPGAAVGASGGVVSWGGRRFAADEGDIATVGDWDCDGIPTVAVLRPATGDVAVFDGWPEPGSAVAGRLVGHAVGAVALRPEGHRGCDVLTAGRPGASGELVWVEVTW